MQLPRPLFFGHIKIDFTTARWDFRSSPQSPPRISGFWLTFELQVGASSRASSWQQGALRCGKKVGWLLCFAMFFLPNYLVGNSRPVLLSSVTPPPWLSKPHAPHPRSHATLSQIKSNNTKKKQGNRPCEWWESQVFNFVHNLIENRRASWSSVTPPPWLSKPHAPRRALRTD